MSNEYREIVLDGELSLDVAIDGDMDLDLALDGEFGVLTEVIRSDYPYYTGETSVTPKTTAQTLETAEKIVMDNIVVLSVPYYETSNTSGETAYIASEV